MDATPEKVIQCLPFVWIQCLPFIHTSHHMQGHILVCSIILVMNTLWFIARKFTLKSKIVRQRSQYIIWKCENFLKSSQWILINNMGKLWFAVNFCSMWCVKHFRSAEWASHFDICTGKWGKTNYLHQSKLTKYGKLWIHNRSTLINITFVKILLVYQLLQLFLVSLLCK